MRKLVAVGLCVLMAMGGFFALAQGTDDVKVDASAYGWIPEDIDLSELTATQSAELSPDEAETASKASSIMNAVFTQNAGQLENGDVNLYLSTSSGGIAFAPGSVMMTTIKREPQEVKASPEDRFSMSPFDEMQQTKTEPEAVEGNTIKLSFVDCNDVEPKGADPASWCNNYFIGNDPAKWRTNVPNYRKVIYENLWDGIDLVYYTKDGNLKYDFIVYPYADHTQIMVQVEGAESLHVNEEGALCMGTGLGEQFNIIDGNLEVYYQDNGDEKIQSQFMLEDNQYSFIIENGRDFSKTLVIDPLVYSTYLGGDAEQDAGGIVVDSTGCAYVCGWTRSSNFPVLGGFDNSFNGGFDVFVSKINVNGDSQIYSTYLGGGSYDYGQGIAVDSSGCVYVLGITLSTDYPTHEGFDISYSGGYDAVISKLSIDGGSLVYSSYFGGSGLEYSEGLFVDSFGCAYICGFTSSSDFPMIGGFDTSYNGGDDAFVSKLNEGGDSLVFFTYLGGTGLDYATGITVDSLGCAYVCGFTRSSDFLILGGFDTSYNNGVEAFVGKLSANGDSLIYSTFLGGSNDDWSKEIAIDLSGCAYVCGFTSSSDFPMIGGFDSSYNGEEDAFVSKLSANGSSLIYSTYLGGSGEDIAFGITVDSLKCAYVCGGTFSIDFPVPWGLDTSIRSGDKDAFVSKLNASGNSLIYSTYLGGSLIDVTHSSVSYEVAYGIVVDTSGCAYICGDTNSTDFPVLGGFDATLSSYTDVFVSKISNEAAPNAVAGLDQEVYEDTVVTFDGTGSNDKVGIVSYTWTFTDDSTQTLTGVSPTYAFYTPGIFTVTLTVADAEGNIGLDTVLFTVLDITEPVAFAGSDQIVDVDTAVILDGSGSTDNVAIVSFSWTFIDGIAQILTGVSPTYLFNTPGVYSVTLTATDAEGNTGTDEVTITVFDVTNPVANASLDQTIDVGTLVTFDGSGSTDNVGIVDYNWTFFDGTSISLTGVSPTFTFDTAGAYTVTLTVSDAAGNTGTDDVIITVNDGTGPIIGTKPVANAGPNQTVDPGTLVTLDASASTDDVGIVNYSWTFTYNSTAVVLYNETAEFMFDIAGVYNITLTVKDAAGNTATDTVEITVGDDGSASEDDGGGWILPVIIVAVLLAGVAVVAIAGGAGLLFLMKK